MAVFTPLLARAVPRLVFPLSLAAVCVSQPAVAEQVGHTSLVVHRATDAMSCPDDVGLIEAIDAVGSPQQDQAPTGPLSLDVSIDRNEAGEFRATIVVSGRKQGKRVLTGPGKDCGPLVDALAVTLALLMDRNVSQKTPTDAPPLRRDKENDASSAPTPNNGEAKSVSKDKPEDKSPHETPAEKSRPQHDDAPVAISRPTTAQESAASSETGVRFGADLTYGLPGPAMSWMPTVEVVHTRGPWQLFLGGFWVPSRSEAYAGGTIDVSLIGGDAGFCWRFVGHDDRSVRLWGCGDVAIGRLRGEGRDYSVDRARNRPWYAVGTAVRLDGPLVGPVRWGLRGGGLVTLQGESFSVDGVGRGFASSRVGLFVGPELSVGVF